MFVTKLMSWIEVWILDFWSYRVGCVSLEGSHWNTTVSPGRK
jgi:hypothetical protein